MCFIVYVYGYGRVIAFVHVSVNRIRSVQLGSCNRIRSVQLAPEIEFGRFNLASEIEFGWFVLAPEVEFGRFSLVPESVWLCWCWEVKELTNTGLDVYVCCRTSHLAKLSNTM